MTFERNPARKRFCNRALPGQHRYSAPRSASLSERQWRLPVLLVSEKAHRVATFASTSVTYSLSSVTMS